MTTLREVASLAGVSPTTVSHVIKNTGQIAPHTRARVARAVTEAGYVAAASGVPAPPIGATNAGVSGDVLPALLRMVRAAQPISRAELARRLDVHRSTMTESVRALLAAGILRETRTPAPAGKTGRPSVGLSLHAIDEFVIGVQIGVWRTRVSAMSLDGATLGAADFVTPGDTETLLTKIRNAIAEVRRGVPERLPAIICVGVPGPVDARRSRLLYAPFFGWRDVLIADALHKGAGGCDVPVIVENDATAAAVYEARRALRAGEGATPRDFAVITAGTGIGVGLVIDGEVYRGTGLGGGFAGEFGHMTIVADGVECVCGNQGCWEAYASAASAVTKYMAGSLRSRIGKLPTFDYVVRRAEEGEARAREALERTGKYLGIGIGNVISGTGVERVVVTGRIVGGWKFISAPLREAVGRTMVGRLARWSVKSGDATAAGLSGALEVAAEEHLARLAAGVARRQ